MKSNKRKVRKSIEQKKKEYKKPFKLKKGWKKAFSVAGVCLALTMWNKTTFNDFDAKTTDYALDFPDQSQYYNLILEVEECDVMEKITIVQLAKQKEAPVLCIYKDEVPNVTEHHLDEFTNIYIVGDVEDHIVEYLKNSGFNVKVYKGALGFLKTL